MGDVVLGRAAECLGSGGGLGLQGNVQHWVMSAQPARGRCQLCVSQEPSAPVPGALCPGPSASLASVSMNGASQILRAASCAAGCGRAMAVRGRTGAILWSLECLLCQIAQHQEGKETRPGELSPLGRSTKLQTWGSGVQHHLVPSLQAPGAWAGWGPHDSRGRGLYDSVCAPQG